MPNIRFIYLIHKKKLLAVIILKNENVENNNIGANNRIIDLIVGKVRLNIVIVIKIYTDIEIEL